MLAGGQPSHRSCTRDCVSVESSAASEALRRSRGSLRRGTFAPRVYCFRNSEPRLIGTTQRGCRRPRFASQVALNWASASPSGLLRSARLRWADRCGQVRPFAISSLSGTSCRGGPAGIGSRLSARGGRSVSGRWSFDPVLAAPAPRSVAWCRPGSGDRGPSGSRTRTPTRCAALFRCAP